MDVKKHIKTLPLQQFRCSSLGGQILFHQVIATNPMISPLGFPDSKEPSLSTAVAGSSWALRQTRAWWIQQKWDAGCNLFFRRFLEAALLLLLFFSRRRFNGKKHTSLGRWYSGNISSLRIWIHCSKLKSSYGWQNLSKFRHFYPIQTHHVVTSSWQWCWNVS